MHTEATPVASPGVVPHAPTSPKIYSPVAHGQTRPVKSVPATPCRADTRMQSPKPVIISPNGSEARRVYEKKPRLHSAPPQRPTPQPKQERPIKSAG